MEKMFTVKEIAELLGVSASTIYNMVYRDAIPYVKIGPTGKTVRFDRAKISAWLSKQSNDRMVSK